MLNEATYFLESVMLNILLVCMLIINLSTLTVAGLRVKLLSSSSCCQQRGQEDAET